jgi:hypothetical protein
MTWQHPRPHRRLALRAVLLFAVVAVLIVAPTVLAANTASGVIVGG